MGMTAIALLLMVVVGLVLVVGVIVLVVVVTRRRPTPALPPQQYPGQASGGPAGQPQAPYDEFGQYPNVDKNRPSAG
ncbi:hypothetical protein ACQBAR_17610 [Propionibacteriaceae bacterium Y1685]|uniref:hypothetical protein n=1 Tax=Microlunatus sp. Y1700 TaxID=3418487 RepID=UPI003B808630